MEPNATLGVLPNGSGTSQMGDDEVAALNKALSAGYGTDMSQLSGGAALRVQSLDKTMQAVIQENRHFKLWNRLPKPKAGATVDEWTEQSGIGGYLGGTTNTESGDIAAATGQYNRRVGMVKYLMTRREVSFVQALQNAITDSEAVEYANGALQLLSDAEYLMFEGNSAVVATEYDGIFAQMEAGVNAGAVGGNHIIDAGGAALTSVNSLNQAAATISGFGNFGTPTDLFMSQLAQADFDTGLDPAFRVPLADVPGGGIMLGAPVAGIRTSWGNIAAQPDVFVRDPDQQTPFEVRYPSMTTDSIKPASVNLSVPGTDAQSKFLAAHAGNYRYCVTGINAAGQSTGLVSAQVAITNGQSVVLTITRSAGAQETGYVISRNRMNGGATVVGGTDGLSDFREMVRIPVAGATTTWTDRNLYIPGTVKAYVLNLTASATAITWRQLLPMLRFNLYPTTKATIPWAQLLFGYLRMSKRQHHVVIKNILPNGATTFRPFN